ncbi:hypothetical protein Y032_0050g2052 [Ancylostoma ceylanicum]|uniref:SCP domain-containing protein n=1 Tax=Ancylostoma ceylanicum TaxID=53326 RepID=A0A016U8R2_9BILA|nr:hypothetical protein Y032_0050g2052 [Ancylostoma ceylanicum]
MHNDFRSLVASGQAKDKLIPNGFAPKAANMRKLEYDCRLEEMAAKYARGCVYEHSSNESRYLEEEKTIAGENLFKTSIPEADEIRALEWATKAWFHELREVGLGKENNLTRALWDRHINDPNMQIGHYTQNFRSGDTSFGDEPGRGRIRELDDDVFKSLVEADPLKTVHELAEDR